MVGTAGRLSVEPNAVNVVPGKVEFLAKVRSFHTQTIAEKMGECRQRTEVMATEHGLDVITETVTCSPLVRIDPSALEVIQAACDATASPALNIPIGARHDANQMAQIAPVGMVFVPSKNGLSHNPDELMEKKEVIKGVEALIRTVLLYDECVKGRRGSQWSEDSTVSADLGQQDLILCKALIPGGWTETLAKKTSSERRE